MSVRTPFGSVNGAISGESTLQGTLSVPMGRTEEYDTYEGNYTVTPSDNIQVLATANKVLKHDIVIQASDGYGLPEGTVLSSDNDVEDVIDDIFPTDEE